MTRFFLVLALLLSLSTLTTAAPPKNPQVDAQLHALFNKWDLNHDGFLDKEELAKHFRGPKATPPDGDMYGDKGNLTPLYYQARKKYPGLIFLWSLDKDMDGRVSWTEFEQYGQQYAAALTQRAVPATLVATNLRPGVSQRAECPVSPGQLHPQRPSLLRPATAPHCPAVCL
ncbi:MAG TPA: EF-hand domain-containing protein [Gemmataceae bacterium]|jgi:hypothetical protein